MMTSESPSPLSTRDLAVTLVDLCNSGRNHECYDRFYADDVVSVEAAPLFPGGSPVSDGLPAVRAKIEGWTRMAKMSDAVCEGPFLHGDDKFAVRNTAKMEFVEGPMRGRTVEIVEVGVYTVREGKIVREEFFALDC